MAAASLTIRVNGAQVQRFVGKEVLLLGTGLEAGNMSLKLEACDGHLVNVRLQRPPDGPIACPMEVIGTVTGHNSVTATEVIPHPEWANVFDMETYSSALETIHSDKNLQQYVLGVH